MNPYRWRRLEALFHRAGTLPRGARPTYLRGACPDDPRLAAEVLRLLEASDRAGDFLDVILDPPEAPP